MPTFTVSGSAACKDFSQRPLEHGDGEYFFYKIGDKYLSLDSTGKARIIDFSSETTLNNDTINSAPTAYTPKYGDFKIKLKWDNTITYPGKTNPICRYIISANCQSPSTKIVGYLSNAEILSSFVVPVITPSTTAATEPAPAIRGGPATPSPFLSAPVTDAGLKVSSTTGANFFMIDISGYDGVGKPKYLLDLDGRAHNVNSGLPDFSKIIQYSYVSGFSGTDGSEKNIAFTGTVPNNITDYSFEAEDLTFSSTNDPRGIQGTLSGGSINVARLSSKYKFSKSSGKTYRVIEGTASADYAKPDPESFSKSDLQTITMQYLEDGATSTIPASTSITGFLPIDGTGTTLLYTPFQKQMTDLYNDIFASDKTTDLTGNRGMIYSIKNTSTTKTCILSEFGHYIAPSSYTSTADIAYAYAVTTDGNNPMEQFKTYSTQTTYLPQPPTGTTINSSETIAALINGATKGKYTPTDSATYKKPLTPANMLASAPTEPLLGAGKDIEIPPGQYLFMFVYNKDVKDATLLRFKSQNNDAKWKGDNNTIKLVTFPDSAGELDLYYGSAINFPDIKTWDETKPAENIKTLTFQGSVRIPAFSFKYKLKEDIKSRTVTLSTSGSPKFLGIEGTSMKAKPYFSYTNTADANFNVYPISDPSATNAVFLLLQYNGNKIIKVTSAGITTSSDADISAIVNSSTSTSTGILSTLQGGWSFTSEGYLCYANVTPTLGSTGAGGTATEYYFLAKPTTGDTMNFVKLSSPSDMSNLAKVQCYKCNGVMQICT